ncbi:MAG: VWA domain-containing protein [Myxococcota bacterium]
MSRLLVALLGIGVAAIGISAWRSHRDLRRWLAADPAALRRALRAALAAGTLGCVVAALSLSGGQPPHPSGAAADVILALDTSRSMDARDTAPSRLRRALRVARRVVEASAGSGARLGLVLFAGDAYVALPLTQDADALWTYLRTIDTDMITRPGSDLARALEVASSVFDPDSSRPREILLLSDGEHAGRSLDRVLPRLTTLGVRVVTVGFGLRDGTTIPDRGNQPLVDAGGVTVESRRRDATLLRIARATGGHYRRDFEERPEAGELLPAPQARPRSQQREIDPTERSVERWGSLALVLLGAEILLSAAPLRPRWLRLGGLRGPAAIGLLLLVGVSSLGLRPWSLLSEGDALLEKGDARGALRLYQAYERRHGRDPVTRIRVGNAHFRLGDRERAATQFLSALRALGPEDREARFVASFNLGVSALALGHFEAARDAFWQALLDEPDHLEAKFNYEWALERIPPEPDVPMPPTPRSRESDGGTEPDLKTRPERSAHGPDAGAPAPDLEETERWLSALEEDPEEPLRRQIAATLGSGPSRGARGQTW